MSETHKQVTLHAFPELVEGLNRIAAALERLADVYLHCNQPEGDEGEELAPPVSVPDGFKGIR